MRKAMNLLVDRQYIVDTIAQADQEIANTFIPTGMSDGQGGEFRVNDDAYTYPNEEAVGYFDPSPEAYDANVERQEPCWKAPVSYLTRTECFLRRLL